LSYLDFLLSASAIAQVFAKENSYRESVGSLVRECVRATRRVVATNSNLGIILLLAPLAAAVDPEEGLRVGVQHVLARLDVTDARLVYDAIRLARPGGLGRVDEQDVNAEPTKTLRKVMALAAERDLVARQYSNGFTDVFDDVVPAIKDGLRRT